MKRPVIAVAIIFISGVAAGLKLEHGFRIFLIIGLFMGLFGWVKDDFPRRLVLVLSIFFGLGFLAGIIHQKQTTLLHDMEKANIPISQIESVKVKVQRVNRYENQWINIEGELQEVAIKGREEKHKTRGVILISIKDHDHVLASAKPGDSMVINSFLQQESLLQNPSKDYYQHLKERGFHAVFQAEAYTVQIIPRHPYHPISFADQTKTSLIGFINQHLEPPESDVLKSILLGNQGFVSKDLRNVFAKTGTAHIIAVSGLHTGIIALMIHESSKALGLGLRAAKIITLLLVWQYALLVGLPVSIVRAATMLSIMMLSFFLERHYDSRNALMITAMTFVILDPATLQTISFQLSFLATASILWGLSLLAHFKMKRIPLRNMVLMTLLVQIGTWPIVAYHFNEFSIIAPLMNLLVVPVLGILMTTSLIAWLLSWVPFLPVIMMHTVNGILIYMIKTMSRFSHWKYASISIDHLSAQNIVVYYALIIVLALILKKKLNGRRLS
ncbi:ComEC/Rec2 family competence protein [Tindallia californiensis]|uniref:Competence protein ComEC n=1 Tax=Tindallia californiensis TaxID=159292 RepID=A0A1H3IV41_9FIRM|nr:ComEC/Rec2 family competence protein [Tindallia californiensis]SDY31427.1 competence protein ComEC [Tindallia californiensis]